MRSLAEPVKLFRGRPVPDGVSLTGYGALIHGLELNVPSPHQLSGAKPNFARLEAEGWSLYSPRHLPTPTLEGHLTFALRYEPVDLLVLKVLFETVGAHAIEEMVRTSPTGQYARRAWFFYEWLMDATLDLPDAGTVGYVNAIDPDLQVQGAARNSKRHRVRNNLPGTRSFCPLVAKTASIERFINRDLAAEAAQAIGPVPQDILARAAAFLLLKDSKSTYAIEGERPPQDRIQRWGQAIGQAGRTPLSHDEFRRLQQIVIADQRFTHMGYRVEGGFIGSHDRQTQAPIPEHLSARHQDLADLMDGLIEVASGYTEDVHPVIAATALAFGFVYIHPFEDGNGRVHRYLIHHVLAAAGFNPPGLVFPVSSAIEQEIDRYVAVLRSHSARIFDFIDWRPTKSGNVEILNETADLYRYFDATPHAEFLFDCVVRTIETDLPREVAFLQSYDAFASSVEAILDMPDSKVSLLHKFLDQHDGRLLKRAQLKEFEGITPNEVEDIERLYAECFS